MELRKTFFPVFVGSSKHQIKSICIKPILDITASI